MTLRHYRLRVELRGVEPPVWRVLRVPGRLSLADLHLVLQAAMGWEDRHLWRFEIGEVVFGRPEHLDLGGREVRDAAHWGLADLDLPQGETLRYVYDFGDRWDHAVRVEEVRPSGHDDPGEPARVLDGARRCPPEDVGGFPAYAEALQALDDPSHPEHATWKERLGPDFDPDAFSADVANAALLALFEPGGRIGTGELLPIGWEEVPLDPEVADAVSEVVRLQEERAEAEEPVTEAVRSVAEELLLLHAEGDGAAFLRARKPATWAAGALHAAFLELRVREPRRSRMTLEELGELFGISPASVGRRSRELRETAGTVIFLPFGPESAAGRALVEALEELREPGGSLSLEEVLARLPVPGAPLSGLEAETGEVDEGTAETGDERPEDRAERDLLIGEESRSPDAYRRAARVIEDHADEIERESLEYLLRRGLETAPAGARRPLMALAVRHFGTEVATWSPEGAGPWLEGGR